MEVDFEVQLTSNEAKRTKDEGVLEQNDADVWKAGAILHNETKRAHLEGMRANNKHQP